MSWPEHHVPALTVTSGGRGVGFDMHAYLPTARHGVGRMVSLWAGGWPTIFSRLLHYGLIFSYGSIFLLGLHGWALRFGLSLLWCDFTGTRFPEVRPHRRPVLLKRPWSLRGSRGYAPHGYMGLMAGHAACCTQYTRCCPFGPCTGAVHGAPGHNRGGVTETPLPVRTQGETMNCCSNLLIFPTKYCSVCGF